jgi:hypothetical protein
MKEEAKRERRSLGSGFPAPNTDSPVSAAGEEQLAVLGGGQTGDAAVVGRELSQRRHGRHVPNDQVA